MEPTCQLKRSDFKCSFSEEEVSKSKTVAGCSDRFSFVSSVPFCKNRAKIEFIYFYFAKVLASLLPASFLVFFVTNFLSFKKYELISKTQIDFVY